MRCVSLFLSEMDTASAKPRVNGSMLAKHTGQYVCLVGKNMGVSFATAPSFAYAWGEDSVGFYDPRCLMVVPP